MRSFEMAVPNGSDITAIQVGSATFNGHTVVASAATLGAWAWPAEGIVANLASNVLRITTPSSFTGTPTVTIGTTAGSVPEVKSSEQLFGLDAKYVWGIAGLGLGLIAGK